MRFGTERESSVYSRILHDSELPEPVLTQQQRQKLDHAKRQICRNDACTNYTSGYTAYLKYKREENGGVQEMFRQTSIISSAGRREP